MLKYIIKEILFSMLLGVGIIAVILVANML